MDGSSFAIVLTSVVGLVTLWINKRHETRLVELQAQNTIQAAQIKLNDENISVLKDENAVQAVEMVRLKASHKACVEDHKKTKDELNKARDDLSRKTDIKSAELQVQIDSLKKATGSKDC